MKTIAFGLVIFPSSWRFGLWRREKKNIFSVGPIRFVLYKAPGVWKPAHGDRALGSRADHARVPETLGSNLGGGSGMKTIAFGLVIFPSSWRFGLWRREKKNIFSVGPIRFVLYKAPGVWKPAHGDAGV